MVLLVIGVLLWAGVHFIPSLGLPLKEKLVARIGENGFKGIFSLLLIASIVSMVMGWRSAHVTILYSPATWTRAVTLPLVFVGFFLFMASSMPSNIKRLIRHPQLTGVAVWAAAHLIPNGDSRALVLFGGLGLWALLEMPAIGRRDGAWEKPEPRPLTIELQPLIAAVVFFAVMYFAHPYFSGASLRPAG
jgi:uncharacterized membrane protein